MSEAPKQAVFLSYASPDVEPVGRIEEALRQAGLEVWFDKHELRGGDAWDQKIRRQIKDCTLFVPVISRNTDARPEGYFRLEWKLAVDRSHLFADDHAFLLPVIIGDTPEATARVPDEFREVQWTRLGPTETPTAFAERVKQLLGGGGIAVYRHPERTGRSKAISWPRVVLLLGLCTLVFVLKPMLSRRADDKRGDNRPKAEAAVVPPTPPKAEAPVSEARKLMAQAKALFEPWDGATRADFAVAEKLLTLAIDKDSADGEVWAASGLMHCGMIVLGFDRSQPRIERARNAAEQAVRLAPDSVQAKFAQAFAYRFNPVTRSEVDNILSNLIEKAPTDRLLIRTYASVLGERRKFDEAIKVLDRAIALPGGDPVAEYNQFTMLSGAEKFTEAEALLDRAIAAHPKPYLYRVKAQLLLTAHGDLDGAMALLPKLPRAYMLEDDGAMLAHLIFTWRREPEKALRIWGGIGREIIECNQFNGPKAFLVGQANLLAKRPAAADADWKAALQVVERLHAVRPNVTRWAYWQARLLAVLGRREEAEEALKTVEELVGAKGVGDDTVPIYLLLGRKDEVLTAFEKRHATLTTRGNATQLKGLVNSFRLNPELDLLRDEPRFQKLIAQSASEEKK